MIEKVNDSYSFCRSSCQEPHITVNAYILYQVYAHKQTQLHDLLLPRQTNFLSYLCLHMLTLIVAFTWVIRMLRRSFHFTLMCISSFCPTLTVVVLLPLLLQYSNPPLAKWPVLFVTLSYSYYVQWTIIASHAHRSGKLHLSHQHPKPN